MPKIKCYLLNKNDKGLKFTLDLGHTECILTGVNAAGSRNAALLILLYIQNHILPFTIGFIECINHYVENSPTQFS